MRAVPSVFQKFMLLFPQNRKQNKDAFMKEGSAMCEELDKIINAKLDAREERGRNEGRSEGEIDSKRRTARNLTKMGMSIEQIAEAVEEDISVVKEWIAESVETPDENTWVFTIRDGVTFSNGKVVDAEAVKACFERTYGMNERADSTLKIASMEADGMQFTIVTPEPDPTLLNDLCDPLLGI